VSTTLVIPTAGPATNLHALLRDMLPHIRAHVGARITVRCEPALVEGDVAVPAADLRDAIMALVANAATAMPEGGTLTIRTEHVEAAGAELGPVPPLAAGRYMRVTVQDTGLGMDEGMRVDAIDTSAGDSRGLARVLDLLRRVHGALWLDSARSYGTRAFLYLPVDAEAAGRRRATVLLVEDETAVRSVVRRMLHGQGFAVREARDGEGALRMWHAERAHIRAVITDVVMPVMGGRDLARELRLLDRDLPVLFISAYADDEPGLLEGVDEPRRLLPKPFSNEGLLDALRALLAEPE
jgi:CheY-like chemotaxis protein